MRFFAAFIALFPPLFWVGTWWAFRQLFLTGDGRWLLSAIGCPIMATVLTAASAMILVEGARLP